MQGQVSRACRGLALLAGLIAGSHVTSAQAGSIALDVFHQFSFTDAGVQARGCAPADPEGEFCVESSGTPALFLDAPAWTFSAGPAGARLTVLDAFLSTERFEIFDFGVSIGLTSLPGEADCGDDPADCLANAAMSTGLFRLGAGEHSITLVPLLSDGLGSGFLRVVADVPEPASVALILGCALAAAGLRRRPPQVRRAPLSRLQGGWVEGPFIIYSLAGLALVVCMVLMKAPQAAGTTIDRFAGPTSSQPLALTADDAFLAVANPDNNSVSFFDLRGDRNRKLAEVAVQKEPNGVAFLPNGSKAYVANTASGTVSVLRTSLRNGAVARPRLHIPVGTEPYGLCVTPNGKFLYVSNARSNSISVIDTVTDTVIKTITGVGFEPRGIAITNDGDGDDADETVYVTQFLSLPIAGKIDGADDAKRGFVTVLSTTTHSVVGQIGIDPVADTGFNALGDALARIPPGDPANPANFRFKTGAYPNMLNNVAIHGNFAYLPNVGASPNGPVRFDVNTHSLLSVIDRTLARDAGKTINMHLAVAQQTDPKRLFITLPWAMAFEHGSNEAFVVSAASNIVVKVVTSAADGSATVQSDPTAPPGASRVLQIKVGKNPRGIVINSSDTRAYVANHISRDVSAINLAASPEAVLATFRSASLPAQGSLAEKVHIGKELYNTSVGEFDPAPGSATPITGRMSNNGWGACSACHTPFALTDNVVWIFPPGPRRTIPQHTDFDQTDPGRNIIRALNWSAERDEEEDFELNIRVVSGGQGLIVLADGVTPDSNVQNFVPLANANRLQLKVRNVGAWDALKAFIQFGVRSPISPVADFDPDVISGRALFTAANCQACHGGPQWTSSRVRFTPPPDASLLSAGQLIGELRKVGTFDPTAFNEVRQNAAAPLGADGFAPASLLSLFAFPQTFLHNGVLTSLEDVLANVTHRSAGTGGVDTLSASADRQKLIKFLQSIDADTVPINP